MESRSNSSSVIRKQISRTSSNFYGVNKSLLTGNNLPAINDKEVEIHKGIRTGYRKKTIQEIRDHLLSQSLKNGATLQSHLME